MAFKVQDTDVEGMKFVYPHIFEDTRGYYKKYFEKSIFEQNQIPVEFHESSEIIAKKGSLRGLHYQTESSQGKLIHVIKGRVFDVALDLREGSRTFGQWRSFDLDENSNKLIYIPEGFAHGFLALEDTIFSYQCTGSYLPEFCGGIRWNDETLRIPWPIDLVDFLIISEKDRQLQSFEQYKNSRLG